MEDRPDYWSELQQAHDLLARVAADFGDALIAHNIPVATHGPIIAAWVAQFAEHRFGYDLDNRWFFDARDDQDVIEHHAKVFPHRRPTAEQQLDPEWLNRPRR